jgi:hypothetical protein
MAGREVVRAVEHHVGLLRQTLELLAIDPLAQRDDVDLGIHRKQRRARGLDLGRADRIGPIEDLPLEIGEVDAVGVGEDEAADARRRKVQRRRTAQAADADDQGG